MPAASPTQGRALGPPGGAPSPCSASHHSAGEACQDTSGSTKPARALAPQPRKPHQHVSQRLAVRDSPRKTSLAPQIRVTQSTQNINWQKVQLGCPWGSHPHHKPTIGKFLIFQDEVFFAISARAKDASSDGITNTSESIIIDLSLAQPRSSYLGPNNSAT